MRRRTRAGRLLPRNLAHGVGTALSRYVEQAPINALSLDWTIDRAFARGQIPDPIAIQGNLDPVALLAGGPALDREVDDILHAFAGRSFIFNLGHGILPGPGPLSPESRAGTVPLRPRDRPF